MWIRHIFLGLFGFAAGIAIAAGTFAFIIMIGIVPRIAARSKTAKHTLCYENAILLGGLSGDILSVFLDLQIPGGRPLLILYGFCAGIFVGCVAVALAEILKALPIFFRRVHVKEGLPWLILFMAIGKMLGSYFYFFFDMAAQ
mgnify:FL=1